MKLKKFAALALAGMMAVSMLAACSDKTTNGEEEDNQIVATSDAVTYANDALSASMKEHATFKANPTLDGWVKDIATNTDNLSADQIKTAYKDYTSVTFISNDAQNTLRTKLKGKLMDSNVIWGEFNSVFTSAPKNKDSQCSSLVYVLSGVLDEKSAVQMAVKSATNDAATKLPLEIENNKYTCEYSPEISALRVTNESLTGESAWVVAIVVTQTVTEAANVEA